MCKTSLKVLIADDSELLRERLTRLLSAIEGVEVAGEAPDGATALQMVQVVKPDVLILDLRMPRGSGVEVLQQIRQAGGKMKVIILTSFPYPQYRERCLAAGADFFFDKSEELELVSATLRQLCVCEEPAPGASPKFSAAG